MTVRAPEGAGGCESTERPTNNSRLLSKFLWWRHNRDVAWDAFDPQAYWQHNYSALREDDRQIIAQVAEFLGRHFTPDRYEVPDGPAASDRQPKAPAPGSLRGLDLGCGSNLYPTLAMLPWCRRIELIDYSQANVDWMRQELKEPHQSWGDFWKEFVASGRYGPPDFATAAAGLNQRVKVSKGNVFALSPLRRYDVGTMFFVAESLSNYPLEFKQATKRFLSCLKPGAPFAAAFMDSSEGYVVADKSFPAVHEVTTSYVQRVLDELGTSADVKKIEVPANDPLRDGYQGMILAVGTARTPGGGPSQPASGR